MNVTEEKSRIRIRTKTSRIRRNAAVFDVVVLCSITKYAIHLSIDFLSPLTTPQSLHPTVLKCDHKHVRLYVSYISLDEWM
jgi:hypothetical protein